MEAIFELELTTKFKEEEDGVIKQVIQAGYTIGDRLIRPALVAVSVKSST